MEISFKQSISRKFMAITSAVVTVILLVFAAVSIYRYISSVESRLGKQLDNAIQLAEKSLPSALWQFNYDYINDFVDSLFLYEDLVAVRVKGKNKVIETKTRPQYKASDFDFLVSSAKYMVKKTSITHEGFVVGIIDIAFSRDKIRSVLFESILFTIILLIVIITSISFSLLFAVKRYVFNRLIQLEKSANLIAGGNLDEKINTDSEDEVGSLAKSLEIMRGAIKDSIEKVRKTDELAKANLQLELALNEIKTLRGILPVCSFCKNIRDDKGAWSQIESYISEHSEAEFTHSICPDCLEKKYPEK